MATAHRQHIAKQLLQAQIGDDDARPRHASKPPGAKPPPPGHNTSARPIRRHKHPHRLPSPTTEQLEQREQGWNDRFSRDTPSQPKRPPRARRNADELIDTHEQKERKIREERQQYGHGDPVKLSQQQRPGVGRLVPIASLAVPPREPETVSSKEEKLRFNVLKAIDIRETLIYQLNALILCTPVQEALVMAASRVSDLGGPYPQLKPRATMALAPATQQPHGSGSAMSNAREAMRLAHQLGADLQISGIHVVEGIVEWMLEAGAKAEKPPTFVWRGKNYFLKMETDLDFAAPELHARGVELDCFSQSNPLCIRPDQRLGRVLAAQSIIKEMVEMARREVAEQGEDGNTPQSGRKASGRKLRTHAVDSKSPRNKAPRRTPREQETEKNPAAPSPKPLHAVSADEMIVASGDEAADEYDDDDDGDGDLASARSTGESPASNQDQHDDAGMRDHETEKELVNILDESFSDVAAALALPPQHQELVDVPTTHRSTKSSSRDEYENSFDGDEEAAVQPETNLEDLSQQAEDLPSSIGEAAEPDKPPVAADNQIDSLEDADGVSEEGPKRPEDSEAVLWARAAQALEARGELSSGDISGSRLLECVTWIDAGHSRLRDCLHRSAWSSVHDALEGSLLRELEAGWSTAEALQATVAFLTSDPALVAVQLSQVLWEECRLVIHEICVALVADLQRELERISPLVSEVDFSDVVDAAQKLLQQDETRGTLHWLAEATELMREIHPTLLDEETKRPPQGLSRLVQTFYPYLISQRRDKLVHNWRRVDGVFREAAAIELEKLTFLLDGTCKLLLLNVAYLRRVSEEDDNDDDSAVSIPKLSIVCDRSKVLESSIAVYAKKCQAAADSLLPNYHIFPFYQSSFGEKLVDGVSVEEGEGKGPLKEWFTLVGRDLTAKWRAVEVPTSDASNEFDPVRVSGNKLVVDRLEGVLKAGYKVEWVATADGTTVSRIINKCDAGNGAYMLDRGGMVNQSFPVSELRVFAPRTAYFEYIQASESYWLSEAVADDEANHHVFAFVGWFFANAIIHQCSLQLRVHRLLFELLLNDTRVVTLPDLQSLDSSLYTAMQQMQHMKASEFASYLDFEGVPSHLTVDEYTAQTIDQKYGAQSSVAWQVREIRRGFHRVFTERDLQMSSVSATDLVDQLCGDVHTISQGFALDQIFRASLDPDFASCTPLRSSFWDVVNGFDPSMKRKLVKFITGVDTLPQAGTEFLRIEMPFPAASPIDCEKTLRMLPQSHTCDNTLELPHYWRALCWKAKHDAERPNEGLEKELAAMLRQKLELAAEYSSGYGLDGTKSAGGSLAGLFPTGHGTHQTLALDIQDSYESLDLPGLGGQSEDGGGESRTSPPAVEDPETADVGQRREEEEHEDPPVPTRSPRATTGKPKDEEEYGAEDWEEEEEEETEVAE